MAEPQRIGERRILVVIGFHAQAPGGGAKLRGMDGDEGYKAGRIVADAQGLFVAVGGYPCDLHCKSPPQQEDNVAGVAKVAKLPL